MPEPVDEPVDPVEIYSYCIESYVNVEPALRALMCLDKRISKAVEYLKDNKIEEAINLIKKAGLEDDQIIFIISTVLKKTLEDAENIYLNCRKHGTCTPISSNSISENLYDVCSFI